jgi:23S rRNA (uridine2552-2'-O)-methyltransferase
VFKLEEIDRRVQLLRPGQRVLDLGAHPGSWSLYASQRVGAKGRVIGIDLQEHRGALPPNVEMRTADVLTLPFAELGTFDVVLSDMAPSTTGQKSLDQARSFELFMHALAIAEKLLAPGGHFVAKIFQGGDFPEAQKAVRAAFEQTKIIRPEATRAESYETFLIGLRRRKALGAAPAGP